MTREQFAFEELDARRAEDAMFPVPPDPDSKDWPSADALVRWARARDA